MLLSIARQNKQGEKMIQDWIATATLTANGQRLFEEVDYDDYKLKKVKFEGLPADKKQKYKGLYDYINKHGGPDLNQLQKNYILLKEETTEQLSSDSVPDSFEIDSFDYGFEIHAGDCTRPALIAPGTFLRTTPDKS